MTYNDWSISTVCFWHRIVYIAQADLFSKGVTPLQEGMPEGELSFFERVIEGHWLSRWKNE